MHKVSYKVQCGQSTVQYESDFEHKSQERIEELTRLVTEMEVRRLSWDIDKLENESRHKGEL